RPVADHRDLPRRVREAHLVAERGGDRPTDRAGLELNLEATAFGQTRLYAVEPRVAGLDQERGVLAEGGVNLARTLGDCEFVPRRGGGRLLLRPAAGELHQRGVVAPDLSGQRSKEI